MLLHPRPLLRVNTSAIEELPVNKDSSEKPSSARNSGAGNNNNNKKATSSAIAVQTQPAPGVVKNVWIDTSADDLIIVTERNTLHFCRLNAVSQQESDRLDVLTLHPTRETTAARRFVSRTSAKMHAGLCAVTFDAEKLLIFNGSRSATNPIGYFSCQPNSLRFREPFYPIQRFEWVPQRVGCNYDTSRIYMAVITSISIELVQVFPLASSQDTVIRKLQRFITTTDFCTVDSTARRLSFLCINASRKGVLKFFNVTDPVAEAQHTKEHSVINIHSNNNASSNYFYPTHKTNNNDRTAVSSTNATPGVSAHNSPSARDPASLSSTTASTTATSGVIVPSSSSSSPNQQNLGVLSSSNNNNNRTNYHPRDPSARQQQDTSSMNTAAIVGGDPVIEHHLEFKIDEEAVVDPQYAFREMFPDPKHKTKSPNYFIRLITIYAEHYCAVVARTEVVLYRYDTSIPYFACRPLNERPYRSFVLSLPQSDKFSLMVLDNEIIMQSLSPPFLTFSYDTACDQSTFRLRDLELTECMRRVGGLGGSGGSSASSSSNQNSSQQQAAISRGASPSSQPNSFLLNPTMTAASGPNMMNSSPGNGGSNGGGVPPTHLPALATVFGSSTNDEDGSSASSSATASLSASVSSSSTNKSNAEVVTEGGGGAFARLAGLLSLPTLHISAASSNKYLVPLKPKIPTPLDNIPLPELAGGGGIFCDTSEPVFLSLGTDFLQRLAAKGHTRLPPEQMIPSSQIAKTTTSNTKNDSPSIGPSVSSQKHKMIQDIGNPNAASNGCNAANVEVFLIGRNKSRNAELSSAISNSRHSSRENSPESSYALPSSYNNSNNSSGGILMNLNNGTTTITSLCARGGSIGRDHFRTLFSNAVKNQQSLSDIEKLLDDAVAGFILSSCAAEPAVSTSGLRVIGRWQLDYGSSAKRSYSAPWAMPLLSEDEVRKMERDDDEIAQQQEKNRRTTSNTQRATNNPFLFFYNATEAEEEDEKRGRRGRLETHIPLVVAGAAADNFSRGGAIITAPAAHLQLVIAQILDDHIQEATLDAIKDPLHADPRRLRYLRGVALEVLRCFRCLIIYPLQQAIVDAYLCGLDESDGAKLSEQEQEQQKDESNNNANAIDVKNSLVDLWGLLQLISFRFLAESPQLAAKLIQVGVRTRIRQLVQSGLDMLGRLGAFHELATALLHLGDLLAAVRVACKHNLQQIASRCIIRAHQMDMEFADKGKQCFSAAAKRKMLPLVLMMLRSRGGGTLAGNAVVDGSSNSSSTGTNNTVGVFQAVIESTLKGLQQNQYFS